MLHLYEHFYDFSKCTNSLKAFPQLWHKRVFHLNELFHVLSDGPTFCKFSHIFYTMRHFNLRRFNHSISQFGHSASLSTASWFLLSLILVPSRNLDIFHHYQLHLAIWIFIFANYGSISQFGFFDFYQIRFYLAIWIFSYRNLDFFISQFGYFRKKGHLASSRYLAISQFGYTHQFHWFN